MSNSLHSNAGDTVLRASTSYGGQLVAEQLKKEGVETVFALIGNHVSPILVNLDAHDINIIHTRHEQGSVHMADGWAQMTRNVGVAIVSGGPGFTNTFTGIIKAFFARTPLLIITGAVVPQARDKGVLQDLDQVSMIRPYTKWIRTVYETARIPEYISRAIQLANSGRKGPVVLEIPINVLKQSVESTGNKNLNWPISTFDKSLAPMELVDKLVDKIASAKRPVIIAGDDVYYEDAGASLRQFIDFSVDTGIYRNKARRAPDSSALLAQAAWRQARRSCLQ